MAGESKRRVVKVGGSLLSSPTLVDDLRRWTALQPPAATFFLAGGGGLVDAIAEQQRTFGFDDEAAHWLCIRAMQIHFEMLAALMRECGRITIFDDRVLSELLQPNAMCWLDPWALMQHDLTHAEAMLGVPPLPADWSVSSDSIAARAAKLLGADELVLLKSTLATAGEADYVDGYFAIAAAHIPRVRFVDLRDPTFPESAYG